MIAADEWETICMLIEEGWPGEFTDSAATAWRVFLDDYEPAQVLVAIKTLVARGGTFRPSVAQVAAEIRSDPSRPTFDEMCRLVYGRRGVLRARPVETTFADEADRGRAVEQAARDRATTMHPLVQGFCRQMSLVRLRDMQLDHEDYGERNRRELERRWDLFCETQEGREVAAIAQGRRGEIAHLDPLSALGLLPPRQLGAGSGA